jgi:hypothetical protein
MSFQNSEGTFLLLLQGYYLLLRYLLPSILSYSFQTILFVRIGGHCYPLPFFLFLILQQLS